MAAKTAYTTIGAGDMPHGLHGGSPALGSSPVSTLNPLTSEASAAAWVSCKSILRGAQGCSLPPVQALSQGSCQELPVLAGWNLCLDTWLTHACCGPQVQEVVAVQPGSFDVHAHYYARVLNAQMHPIVRTFLGLGNERIAKRYCHLHPEAAPAAVHEALQKVRPALQLPIRCNRSSACEPGCRLCHAIAVEGLCVQAWSDPVGRTD